ncbi:SNARE complex subunit Vam7 [Cordyceps militaris]|uniref:SNARE complex subunit Vam7 n=1 Tax=Cordyceps militaris TaxID=73501 RepID=A0A2H4S6W6_CORMI|nr:SNARE complex subunit Vam7 [Cordyceps militaris]
MSIKREHEDVDVTEPPEPERKRSRKSRPTQNSSVDPDSGQKYVFANYHNATTIPVGEESDFEDDTDAMAYLITQASGIPHVLAAPKKEIGPKLPGDFVKIKHKSSDDGEVKDEDDDQVDRSIYHTGISDTRGFYEDGAYIGRKEDSDDGSSDDWAEAEDEDGHISESAVLKAYFGSILHQYQQLRLIVNQTPPADVTKRITSSHFTHVAAFGPGSTAIKIWPSLLRNTDPTPLQISCMSKDTVIRILRIMLGGKFLRRGYSVPERTSRWIWALLARLPERGELNYSEIGWIRDLGRRAVLLGRSLSEMAALRDELAEGGLGVNDAVDASSSDEEVVADEPASPDEASAPSAEASETVKETGNMKDEEEEDKVKEEEEEDVAMELESGSDEGEIREDNEEKPPEKDESLEAAKNAFLARLEAQASDDGQDEDDRLDAARERSRMNMRATLNMILTVAGEFYGQRDLLEFREPFVGIVHDIAVQFWSLISNDHVQILLFIKDEEVSIFKILVDVSVFLADGPVDGALLHARVRNGQEASVTAAPGAQLTTELLHILLVIVDALAGGRGGGLIAVDGLLGHATDLVDAAKRKELARGDPGAGADHLGGAGRRGVGPELEGAVALGLVAFRDRLAHAHADAQQVRLDAGRQHGRRPGGLDGGRTRLGAEEGGDLALSRVRGGAGKGALDSGSAGHDGWIGQSDGVWRGEIQKNCRRAGLQQQR